MLSALTSLLDLRQLNVLSLYQKGRQKNKPFVTNIFFPPSFNQVNPIEITDLLQGRTRPKGHLTCGRKPEYLEKNTQTPSFRTGIEPRILWNISFNHWLAILPKIASFVYYLSDCSSVRHFENWFQVLPFSNILFRFSVNFVDLFFWGD